MLARTVLALSLVVRVYDNVGVANGDMASALAVAHTILKNAGIEVTWRGAQRGQEGRLARAELIVRIVAAPPAASPRFARFLDR